MSGFIPNHVIVEGRAPSRTVFILHGILGSSRNWKSYSRKLAQAMPDWRFVLVDLRNHGDSSGAEGPHTLDACADDLQRLAAATFGPPSVMVGHSFGGKVALTYARKHGKGLAQAWMLDATPGATDPTIAAAHSDVVRVIRALRAIPAPVESRQIVVEGLRARGFSESLASWMTTNLKARRGGGFDWKFDLDGVEEMLADYLAADLWPFVEDCPEHLEIHVVRAARSERWPEDTIERLEGIEGPGVVRLHTLADAGHWVHIDNPRGLQALLTEWLPA